MSQFPTLILLVLSISASTFAHQRSHEQHKQQNLVPVSHSSGGCEDGGHLEWKDATNDDWRRDNMIESGKMADGQTMYVCRCQMCGPSNYPDETLPGYVSCEWSFDDPSMICSILSIGGPSHWSLSHRPPRGLHQSQIPSPHPYLQGQVGLEAHH